jgi:hypothetical protein
MIIRDDADIFDDLSASRLNPVKEKPDYRKLQWIDVVPGLQTWVQVPVEIHDQTRQTTDESDEPQDKQNGLTGH